MRKIWIGLALAGLLASPSIGEASSNRIGVGYSLYPQIGGLFTLRYSTYGFLLESGIRVVDAGESQILYGSKFAIRPYEYRGIPLEIGGSLGIDTKAGPDDTLIFGGIFVGLSSLVTDEISIGVAVYPVGAGFGLPEDLYEFLTPTIDIHFLF